VVLGFLRETKVVPWLLKVLASADLYKLLVPDGAVFDSCESAEEEPFSLALGLGFPRFFTDLKVTVFFWLERVASWSSMGASKDSSELPSTEGLASKSISSSSKRASNRLLEVAIEGKVEFIIHTCLLRARRTAAGRRKLKFLTKNGNKPVNSIGRSSQTGFNSIDFSQYKRFERLWLINISENNVIGK
jgi:hypothetical protein